MSDDAESDFSYFDKFMKEITDKEQAQEKTIVEELTPQREYIRRYRETSINRIRIGRGEGRKQ